jgi:hypothetical protein
MNTGAAPTDAPPLAPQAPPIIIEIPQQTETDPAQQQDLQPPQLAAEAEAAAPQPPPVGPEVAITEPTLPRVAPAPAPLLAQEEGLLALPNPVEETATALLQTQFSAPLLAQEEGTAALPSTATAPIQVSGKTFVPDTVQAPRILGRFSWLEYPEVGCSMRG